MKNTKSCQLVHPLKVPDTIIAISDVYQLNLEYYLKTYFNAAYILLLSPFNISKEKSKCLQQNQYAITGSKLYRKMLCGFLYFLDLFWVLGEIRKIIPGHTNNLGMYFKMAHTFVDAILKAIALKQFWFNQQDILYIINFASGCGSSILHNSRCANAPKITSKLLVIAFIFSTLYFWLLGPTLVVPWNLASWWDGMLRQGRFNVFLETEFKDNWIMDVVIGGFANISFLHRKLLGMFTDLLIIMAVLTVHRATSSFINNLQQQEGITWTYVRGEYETLKELTSCINRFMGKNMGCRLVVLILTWAFTTRNMFFRPSGFHEISKFLVAWYWAASLVILFLCADICEQVWKLLNFVQIYLCK